LVKVAHALVQRGYVNSTQGRGGGLRLARPAAEIRLDALVRDTEPDVHIVECFDLERNTCRITAACGLKHILHDATSAFFAVLGKHSLADITTNPIRNHKRKS
jgi:Rrf2 family nitric oxide-sensitive transcriptional repressor